MTWGVCARTRLCVCVRPACLHFAHLYSCRCASAPLLHSTTLTVTVALTSAQKENCRCSQTARFHVATFSCSASGIFYRHRACKLSIHSEAVWMQRLRESDSWNNQTCTVQRRAASTKGAVKTQTAGRSIFCAHLSKCSIDARRTIPVHSSSFFSPA